MDGTGEHHSEQGQPGSKGQKLYILPHMWSRANAAMLLDLGHVTRGEHIQKVWG
jgi:hypothetical protein